MKLEQHSIFRFCEYFECPIHSVFWIPNIIPTSDNCSLCKQELYEKALQENIVASKNILEVGDIITLVLFNIFYEKERS